MFRILKRAPWIALGALAAWLFDPTSGDQRRSRLRARADELMHPQPTSRPDVEVPAERAA